MRHQSISSSSAFSRFCEISDQKMYQYMALIERTVAGIMREAGEDPADAIHLANRTRQLTYCLNSAAEQKYELAVRTAAARPTAQPTARADHGYRSWSPEERAEYDAMYDW